MELNDLLMKRGISPEEVLVLRHRPKEQKLHEALPWLAAQRPELYNAYQQEQGPKVEKAIKGAKYVASFIGTNAGKALFAGLYAVKGFKQLTYEEIWKIAENKELHRTYGTSGPSRARPSISWFNLVLDTDFFPDWRGRMVVLWPRPERSWWRWADRNIWKIDSISELSAFEEIMPPWNELVISSARLKMLPSKWKDKLREWRGIYYIWDYSDGRGYVGAAFGADNILGRWLAYGASGHGGNKELKKRNPDHFQFSILQRVSPDMPSDEVIQLEKTWKKRLHTRGEFGLNEN